jgi:hypothetical protein
VPGVANAKTAVGYQQRGVANHCKHLILYIYWLFTVFYDFSQGLVKLFLPTTQFHLRQLYELDCDLKAECSLLNIDK